ncbi:putative beta-lysine N-acetyltransferase [Mesobacillus sp. AQ2]|uniref:putative beta-lysine N-acetyltransferase n=1 Tax=unclassified Mesobacillus TaxID=2675270 RepID=UPI00203F89C3|nr:MULTISPECIES: putative beta-lysine N-acetyltransferase [unclassified Mesobacillus]MCM3122063.1 putative beta-lysine N-acetyltransferase [Mesobacillus sp. MER 33]MCM3232027.1 putative beta-lysine N-acetyltransferase [Mesobacillus sp. MER 48]WHX38984.1 putative beta-lysine N-acetyltransferase [Mesobacillus sp. AQ2]
MHLGKTIVLADKNGKMTVYLDKQNKRVRVEDYLGSLSNALKCAEELAESEKADKLIIKGRREHFTQLLEHGYSFEASIDGFFLGSDCVFFSKFLSDDRKATPHWTEEDGIIKSVYHLAEPAQKITPPGDYVMKKMDKSDAHGLSDLYKEVFQIYPTPLNDPEYIVKTMTEGTIYYGFVHDGQIVSAASAEVDLFYKNAEMTDCATLKEHRKHGLMKVLLARLEAELIENGIFCAYSIARSLSFGMNAALYQLGYAYRGRLVNNVYIYDKIENMNVWVKNLAKPPNIGQ